MIKQIIYFLASFVACYIVGCSNEFEPFTSSEDGKMIFSILDNRLPFQYVRTQGMYQKDKNRTGKSNLEIFLSENNGNIYKMRDTIRNDETYKYYYLPGYRLKRKLLYRLTVVEDSVVRSTADCYVWQNPFVYWLITAYEDNGETKAYSIFSVDDRCAEYFLFKLLIKYEVNMGDRIESKKAEVPIWIKINANDGNKRIEDCDKGDVSVEYTKIMKRGDTINATRFSGTTYYTIYNHENIIYALKFLEGNNLPVTIKGAMFQFYSIDKNIYEKFLKAGKEQYSVRLDEPLYWTNIQSVTNTDVGFFGSISVDSVVTKIPVYFINMFGYKDGQK